jgi:hypothetical protein
MTTIVETPSSSQMSSIAPSAAPAARPTRITTPSRKRKESTTDNTPAEEVPKSTKTKLKSAKKADMEEAEQEDNLEPEGKEDNAVGGKQKKEKESKEKACVWLRATQSCEQSSDLPGRAHIMATHKLTLTLPSMGGTPAKTQALQPGDIVTAWTDQAKARKLEFVIYRIQKGKCALHWQLRCRHADEAALTQIAAANVTKVTAGIPQDTEDERAAFLKAEDARDMTGVEIKKKEDEAQAKLKKKLKKQRASAPREPPTLGNILRPADFMAAFQEVRELAQEMKEEQVTSKATVEVYIKRLEKAIMELKAETGRLETTRNSLTHYGMNRSISSPR